MKTFILFSFLIVASTISSSQDTNFTGAWNLIDFEIISDDYNERLNEDKLKEDGSVWDLFFMEESQFKQTSNMSGSGTMDSQEGTWEVKGNNLRLLITMGVQKMEIIYTYEFEENLLVLRRKNPAGTMEIISKFRMK